MQSRKRAAPGTSPPPLQPLQAGQFPVMHETQQVSNAQYNDWAEPNVVNPSIGSTQPFQGISNQLVRRPPIQSSREGPFENDAWLEETNPQAQTTTTWEEVTDDEDLEQRALVAKKGAQAKRKTIPPFIQKLSSFLDESSNTDLIRWSDDGNSFIVLDEDEFANTLIPELFKSNKYASFVRQLNMYGFHKKVGLSDNSMRASEKKAKNPSEFYNPYFKRGRPELLWLIHKPRTGLLHPKRKREDGKGKQAGDSSDEEKRVATKPGADSEGQLKQSEANDGSRNQELATLPGSELASLRQELQALQRQQRFISKVLTQVREQNHQLYQQATAFQALHDRHENSISAILTFLATFYNRNVEGVGAQNLAGMFANAIPQNAQQQGTVEDMGDYREGDGTTSNQLQRFARKPQLLLPPPSVTSPSSTGPRITTESPDPGPSGTQPENTPNRASHQKFNSSRPSASHTRPQDRRQDSRAGLSTGSDASANDIMSLIKDVNASAAASPANDASLQGATSSFDFPAALSHYQSANGNTPLTPQERDNMLALMAKEQHAGANSYISQTSNGIANSNNALTTPNPPPMPSLENFAANQQQLDILQRLQQEQDAKVQSLADRLQPLSPTGSIPGLHSGNTFSGGDGNSADLGQPSDLDLNNFVSNGDYFTGHDLPDTGIIGNVENGDGLFDAPDFDMNFVDANNADFDATGAFDFGAGDNLSGLDGAQWSEGLQGENVPNEELDGRGRIVESVSSGATSPAATGFIDEGTNNDGSAPQSTGDGPSKKRRFG